ncbi:MAG TPA: hypothetical protein VK949_04880 [Methylotenera sp.]|nr:hypothetical protein [Methylotenera sp.]
MMKSLKQPENVLAMNGRKTSRNRGLTAARYMCGQSMVEYFVVTAFTILILIEGADSSVIQTLVTAMKDAYAGFTYALGYSTNLTGF